MSKLIQEIKPSNLQELNEDGHFTKQQINSQLISIETDLQVDLRTADVRMQSVQTYITDLSTQTQQMRVMVAAEKDPQKRSNMYKIINQTLELCATFEGLYLKALEVKHRYRQEFINTIYKKVKLLEIELQSNDVVGELTKVELMKVVETLNKSFSGLKTYYDNQDSQEQNKDAEPLSPQDLEFKDSIEHVNHMPSYNLR